MRKYKKRVQNKMSDTEFVSNVGYIQNADVHYKCEMVKFE